MTREETLARLREITDRVRELRQATDIPALERTMQLIDLYCDIARWELGEISPWTPSTSSRGDGGVA
jgi:hypothetical protein